VSAADEIGYPVALKSFDDSLGHRMDRAGVRLGLATAEQVIAAYEDLSWIAGPWLTVQAMAPPDRADVSTVFTISADPSFGVLLSGITERAVPPGDHRVALLDADPVGCRGMTQYVGRK
jgi:acyl-CoA synthetase (NDP forming)